MRQGFHLEMAKKKAEMVLLNEGIKSLPVDPFAIAENRDIIVKAKPDTAEGVSGMLLRHGDTFGILYATNVPNEGFQRFSVGHELGHYFLDGHIDHVLPEDGFHISHSGFVSADPYELEADSFASGLLMPSIPFKRAISRVDPGIAAIESLSEECRTSLTSTAIRYAELTDDAVAIIISTGQIIDFCFLSGAMKSLPELTWLRKGSAVAPSTETAHFNSSRERILKSDRAVARIDLMDWFGGKKSIFVTEEIVGLGRYGKTLTILSSSSIGQEDDDDDDDESLMESWTPRFRR
jgi:Zn-dependent peptidase ImmA (M78 family)